MRRISVAAALIVLVTASTGCHGATEILQRSDRESSTFIAPAYPAISTDEIIARAQPSVVKVRGEAHICDKLLEGSGFVVAPNKVMTNAHVIAGADTLSVEVGETTYEAQVVSYDPNVDISILDVPDLDAPPLKLAEYAASGGADVLVLGYPRAASFKAIAARIREVIQIDGTDIYRAEPASREVYILTESRTGSLPQDGSSGSAVVDLNGQVIGVYFGTESRDPTMGFALTTAQVAPQMSKTAETQTVGTGGCIT